MKISPKLLSVTMLLASSISCASNSEGEILIERQSPNGPPQTLTLTAVIHDKFDCNQNHQNAVIEKKGENKNNLFYSVNLTSTPTTRMACPTPPSTKSIKVVFSGETIRTAEGKTIMITIPRNMKLN